MQTDVQRQSIPHGKKSLLASLSPLRRGALYYFGYLGVLGLFLPFLNLYFRQELGFSGRQIGLLAIFAPFMTLLFAIPVASLADRRRWRIRLLTIAISGFGTMMFLNSIPHTFVLMALLWLITTATMSPIMPLSDSLIVRMSLRHKLNFGSMRLWGSCGFAIASAIGGTLWGVLGFSMMFTTTGISLLLVLVLAMHLDEEPARDEKNTTKTSLWEICHDTGLIILIGTAFFFGATINMSIVFDGIYISSLGGTKFLIGIVYSLTALGELPTMQYRDRIAKICHEPATLLLACGLLVVSFVGYFWAWQPWMLLFTAATKGLGFGLFLPTAFHFISQRVPEQWSSTVQSIFNASMFGAAPLIAAPLSGEILDRFSPRAIYACASITAVGATLLIVTALVCKIFQHETSRYTQT